MQYYGIWAMRGPASVLGAAEAWSKRDGAPEVFTTKEDAARQAVQYNQNASSVNVRYSVREMEPELALSSIRRQNMAVAQAIDKAVQESNYDTFHYNLKGAAEKVVGVYGPDRVNVVLANILLNNDYDGRYSNANKRWAQDFDIVPDKGIFCNTHPHVLDGFIDRAREITAALEAQRSAGMVGSYTVTRSIQFDNDRGFAYGENPKAAQPFATWQFTSDNGTRDHYWGHYHSGQEAALTDYENRVNEYMADNPHLKVVVDNPLAAAEMSTEQNYNQIDGLRNNIAAPKADLTDGQTLEEIKELAPEMLPVEEKPEPRQSSPPKGRKFENVDVIAALGAVVAKNTVGYQADFEYDKESFIKAAESPNLEDRNFLWLSRRNGTECFAERDAFITTTSAHNHWTYYEGQGAELIPFAVEITGMENGKVMGNLYELDHAQQVQQVKKEALSPESVLLTFKDGEQKRFAYDEYSGHFQQIQQANGRVVDVRYEVHDESALQAVLQKQRDTRAHFPARSFDAFVKKLPQRERPSVADKLDAAKKAVKPPSADKKPPVKSGPEL
ncbi:DUF3849 domain-containing protein [Ohessyouella blattaphilus]|uniref:DUF3849 domain-containing protein n=1 Tax=Ohessyouella blattaphilus TaxID=2949333 RepID=A0ABT1EG85_9FIRM|nr:DUF3849 domain-containing protein [Ohessyouella blattaphilus]MCP1109709.1 DUF3849 domain-containing protein [Ohessyouella blattaphilus]MCR8563103.1 DUF3849 domain-containing protein [Ohessyouella blattaphilus]